MNQKILVTDSLFIFPEHEAMLKNAGYDVERLDRLSATEDELALALEDKVGYILGGIEKVTEPVVVRGGGRLRAIVFTGIGYKDFIPAWQYATEKGIAIANTPDGPTHAVAEWAMTMALAMNRNLFDLGRMGVKDFMTSKGIEGQRIGIIGLGRIGTEIAGMLKPFRPATISYWSKHRHEPIEYDLEIQYADLERVLVESDMLFLCLSKDAGEHFIENKKLALVKDGALLVSLMHAGVIDEYALLAELQSGRIRAASDYAMKEKGFGDLPLGVWQCFNGSNAFNTVAGLRRTSDMATQSMINLLATGTDKHRVN